jgi:hypothetical protein
MNILLKSLTITLSLVAGLQAMDDSCPLEIKHKILTEVVKDNYVNLGSTDFIESVRPLRVVCKQWSSIINKDFMHHAMVLGCELICPEFLNGKLIYRPNGEINDGKIEDGKIELKISNLWNPLKGTFNLSPCGKTDQYLSISTGYRQGKRPENASKVEIWFAPRFLVEKELNGTASHFKDIFLGNWATTAPVGIIWTWGDSDNMNWYDYLTTENGVNLSKINLYENWVKACTAAGGGRVGPAMVAFHVSFVN